MALGLYKVTGDSMLPTYKNGDYVITGRRSASTFSIGDVVVIKHPELGIIIKRILTKEADQGYMISGDNAAASTAASTLGLIQNQQIKGKVYWKIPG